MRCTVNGLYFHSSVTAWKWVLMLHVCPFSPFTAHHRWQCDMCQDVLQDRCNICWYKPILISQPSSLNDCVKLFSYLPLGNITLNQTAALKHAGQSRARWGRPVCPTDQQPVITSPSIQTKDDRDTAVSPLSSSWHGMDSAVSTTCAKEGYSLQTGTGLTGRQPSPDSVWDCTIFFCPFSTRCTKCYDGNCKSLTTSRDKCIYSHKDLSSWDIVSMMLRNTSCRQLHILGLHCMHKVEEFYNSYSIPA